jgi:hypothetical protein
VAEGQSALDGGTVDREREWGGGACFVREGEPDWVGREFVQKGGRLCTNRRKMTKKPAKLKAAKIQATKAYKTGRVMKKLKTRRVPRKAVKKNPKTMPRKK